MPWWLCSEKRFLCLLKNERRTACLVYWHRQCKLSNVRLSKKYNCTKMVEQSLYIYVLHTYIYIYMSYIYVLYFSKSLIIYEENTKENHKRIVS